VNAGRIDDLIAPRLKAERERALADLQAQIRGLVERWRERGIRGSFTGDAMQSCADDLARLLPTVPETGADPA
jgi:hypothetical protein